MWEPGYESQGQSAAFAFIPIDRVQGELEPGTPGIVTPPEPVAYSDFSRPQILHRGSWAPGVARQWDDTNTGGYVQFHRGLGVGVIWDPSRMGYVLPGMPHRENPPTLARAELQRGIIPSGRSVVPGIGGSAETEPI